VFLFGGLQHSFGKCVEHAVAGAIANDEIICKRCNVFDVEKQDVFALFVLQGGDDFMCKIECVQISPLLILPQGKCVSSFFLGMRNTTAYIPSLLVSNRF
jgi:hypothetical protein